MLKAACHKCERRSCGGKDKPGCTGVMLCTVSGRNIIDHAAAGDCPLGKFTEATVTAQPTPKPPKPITEWPLSARIIATLRNETDKGLGDTIHRHLERFGADAMKRLYRRFTGRDCGCGDRQKRLNREFRY